MASSKGVAAVTHPPFDTRIKTLAFPLEGKGQFGPLKRGFMIWDKPIPGYTTRAQVNFLYNPSSINASYGFDSGIAATLAFPNPGDTANLTVPLSQTVTWSVLYDRTYELWGQYNTDGTPKQSVSGNPFNPAVYGVLTDIYMMQQFTGMKVQYTTQSGTSTPTTSTSSTSTTTTTGAATNANPNNYQGILQLVPMHVYFGDQTNLTYYGYITSWDVTITHWTQYMVPMRCVVDITMNLLPPPYNQTSANIGPTGVSPGTHINGGPTGHLTGPPGSLQTSNGNKSGR